MHLQSLLLLCLVYQIREFEASSKASDVIELLKCQIRDLKRSYLEQKKDIEKQTIQIEQLKNSTLKQDTSLVVIRKQVSTSPSRCQIVHKGVCGVCACADDFQLEKKYYCNCLQLKPMRDCLEFYNAGYKTSGLYMVTMNNNKIVQVFCDQETDTGGWTVFQRRMNGKTVFYRDWNSYKNGFGNPHREFWLGNENIYLLTLESEYPKGSELRIDMADWKGNKVFAKYSKFKLDGKKKNYALHVGGYSGNAGNSLALHNSMQFSTYDADHDKYGGGSCSKTFRGAWWYKSCHHVNLNGEYRWIGEKQPGYDRGVIWYHYKGHKNSMKFVEMKARRVV